VFRTVDPRTEEVEFAQSGGCFTDKSGRKVCLILQNSHTF